MQANTATLLKLLGLIALRDGLDPESFYDDFINHLWDRVSKLSETICSEYGISFDHIAVHLARGFDLQGVSADLFFELTDWVIDNYPEFEDYLN